jgi:hypothetical protein
MKEKSQAEKIAAERQVELLSSALGNAASAKGYWLNASGKTYPRFYPKGLAVSPFNALVMALHSDQTGSKTNLFLPFCEAKKQGMSVREHERGVPFLYYNWNKYVNRNNPNDVVSRADYQTLDAEQQRQYKGMHNREIRILFAADQTTLPFADERAYKKLLAEYGNAEERGIGEGDERALHIRFNDFLLKMRENLVPICTDGSGVAHYDSEKDAVYMPRQKDFEHYNDYVQETLRQIVSATGHQQRLAREGMVMKNGVAPSEDAVRHERLVAELASGVKMLELGLPARLSNESLKHIDFWNRELKENPCLIDAIESDVNNALTVIRKAEQGEKIEYATMRNQRETAELKDQLPKHYLVADEIKQHPDKDNKTIVVVIDKENKSADVVLPSGASLEVDNEIKGMNKQRIQKALEREGIETVRFYNPDGALGYRPDDSYFADKQVDIARLKNWSLEHLSTLDAGPAIERAKDIGFSQIQMIQDDKKRWALYIKPEGQSGYSIYPDKADINQFFSTLKQSMDNFESVKMELANKYHHRAAIQPELKVDLFGGNDQNIDLNRIQRVCVFKTKENGILCSATIDGEKVKPRSVTPQQWQRMWVAEDRNSYKTHLAATLFADVLKQGEKQEQTSSEKQEMETEMKQEQQGAAEKHEEEHREYHEEADKNEEAKERKLQEKGKEETKADADIVMKNKEEERQVEKSQKEESRKENAQKPTGIQKQWNDMKAMHPDALLLFRVGDFYEMYNQDARKGANILGITLTKRSSGNFKELAGFPHHALDTYLPKLIRAGERVAICDQLVEPKQQKQQEAVKELVEPARGMRR